MASEDELRAAIRNAAHTTLTNAAPSYDGLLDNFADALMPVVRDALADAWDDGYEGGEDDTFKELRGIPTDRGHNERATNPWREGD